MMTTEDSVMTAREKLHRAWCTLCWLIIVCSILYAMITEPGLGGYARLALEAIP